MNNMDHMRISGTELSSVILSQTKKIKMLKVMPEKCLNKLKPKRDGKSVINYKRYTTSFRTF